MKLVHFLKSHVQFTVFLVLALLIGGVAVFAPAIAPADPYEAVMDNSLLPPDGQHLCGTDKLGRDVLSRVIYGTRSSLSMTLILVGVIFVVGTGLGILAGYFGGALDAVIMRITDVFLSFPPLLLAIALVALLHDACKIGCYKKGFRNVKNDATGQWERVPTYTFDDPLPYGHGEKSVYIANGYIRLSREEAMAIRWHMGFSGPEDARTVGQAFQKYPLAFALATADMEASYFLENEDGV